MPEAAHACVAAATAHLPCSPPPVPSRGHFSLPAHVLPAWPVQGMEGGEGNTAAQFTALHLCTRARKAFPSSRITTGYSTSHTGVMHLSLCRGAHTPPWFCAPQRFPLRTGHLPLPGSGTLGSGDPRKPLGQHLDAQELPLCLTPPPPASPPRNAVNAKADSCPNQLLPLYSICSPSSLLKAESRAGKA